MNESDEDLIIDFATHVDAQRRLEAFNELYDRHSAAVFGYIYNRCENRGAAEDISQQLWTRLIIHADRIAALAQDPAQAFSLKFYLFGMARNAVSDHFGARQDESDPPPIHHHL